MRDYRKVFPPDKERDFEGNEKRKESEIKLGGNYG